MLTPENTEDDLQQIVLALWENHDSYKEKEQLPVARTTQMISIREAMFTAPEAVSVKQALGRICRVPTVSCPPAIPIVVPGEVIDESIIKLFEYYEIEKIDVVQKNLDIGIIPDIIL